MSDYGSQYADRRQKIIEWRLLKVYREAQKDLFKKADAHARRYAKEERAKQRQVAAGIITEQQFKDWRTSQEFAGQQWDAKVRMMTDTLLNYNERALDVIRGEQYNVFAENANYQAYCHEKDFRGGISFDIYDETTVERLIREKPELLPRKVVNGRKDKAWNQGIIANSVTQGILQGESIPDIAKRIARDTASRDNKAMVRYARTAMTAAQNAGRLETMHRAEDMGIKVKKVWMATLDNRTRDAHAELDGVSVDIDESFVNELGEIDYPGDPGASGDNTWNCRCSLGYEYPEYSNMAEQENNTRYDQEYGEEIEYMEYDEWKDWREFEDSITNVSRPMTESEISEENEMLAIKELADKFGIVGDVNDRRIMLSVADEFIDESDLKLPKSRWNGKAKILDDRINGDDGYYRPDTNEIGLYKHCNFATAIHELIHPRSNGLTLKTSSQYVSVEEACAETITQHLISTLAVNKSVAYRVKVNSLGHIADLVGKSPVELATELIDTPITERYDKLQKIVFDYCNREDVKLWQASLYRRCLRNLEN